LGVTGVRAGGALEVLGGVELEALGALGRVAATSTRVGTLGSGALGAKNVGTGMSWAGLGVLCAGVMGANEVGKIAGGCDNIGCGV